MHTGSARSIMIDSSDVKDAEKLAEDEATLSGTHQPEVTATLSGTHQPETTTTWLSGTHQPETTTLLSGTHQPEMTRLPEVVIDQGQLPEVTAQLQELQVSANNDEVEKINEKLALRP